VCHATKIRHIALHSRANRRDHFVTPNFDNTAEDCCIQLMNKMRKMQRIHIATTRQMTAVWILKIISWCSCNSLWLWAILSLFSPLCNTSCVPLLSLCLLLLPAVLCHE
jgi:hypothetical protein